MKKISRRTLEECGIVIAGGQILSRIKVSNAGEPAVEQRKVIVPKSILPDGSILDEDMPEEGFRVEVGPKYLAEAGDIVMKLSTPYDAAVVTEEEAGCVVPSFCAIIRSSGILDPAYLLAFLNSASCKDQLKSMVAGAVMAMLSVGKIRNVLIPVPKEEEQKKLGERFLENQERIKLIREIMDLETKRNDILFWEMEKNS